MSRKVLELLEKHFGADPFSGGPLRGAAILETSDQFGDDTAVVDPARWKEIALFLRDDPKLAFDHFIDLTAIDWWQRRTPRYEVVLHMRSTQRMHRIRLKARLDATGEENPRIDSLVAVWRGADWFERECYDMFGVEFVGHPDLRRILMYPEFVGHPLRKDYPAQKAQPLIPYREDENNEKLPPFGEDMGMPFGRQTHDVVAGERNLLRSPFSGPSSPVQSAKASEEDG